MPTNRTRVRIALTAALLVLAAIRPGAVVAHPEPPRALDAAGIRASLERLRVTGSVLYVGAHPDDENNALLAWFANGKKLETAYLSMTRGDGGQNLIGSDTGTLLGVLRTQELIAARRVDGAEQFFTRALDFGYSKTPEETFDIWGHEKILSDVVWVIRRYRPDVIVTRFATDGSGGHGHHTASAILAEEAFAAAADPQRFPEQLAHVRPWQARRLVWNAYRFGGAGADTTPGRIAVDVGAYDRLLGRSYTEIAGESRSQHKTQGFGSAERRGSFTNSFEHRLGNRAQADLFDGVDLTWRRYPGGDKIERVLARALDTFDAEHPGATVPALLEARTLIQGLGDDPLLTRKRAELDRVLRACCGLWLEAVATAPSVTPGAPARISALALSQDEPSVRVLGVTVVDTTGQVVARTTRAAQALAPGRAFADTLAWDEPAGVPPSRPYWLVEPPGPGSFEVRDLRQIGKPENDPVFRARFALEIKGRAVTLETPVVYRWTDPVRGERYRDFLVAPRVTLKFDRGAHLFTGDGADTLGVTAQSGDRAVRGDVRLRLPAGWTSSPATVTIALAGGGVDTTVRFSVTPPAGAATTNEAVSAEFVTDGQATSARAIPLDYPHLPLQALVLPAQARLVRADVKHTGSRVAYVMGSGDAVPEALMEMGYAVTLLSDDDVARAALDGYDAIVVGVRAYNVRPRLRAMQDRLLAYVANGGRLVVQYQTADPGLNGKLGPLPFAISRDRVTVETAPVTISAPGHPLATTPNRITDEDFAGWVQERGLYFASPADSAYQTPFACHDPGEPERTGGLLYATHGKGAFIYTGYAWFRQLPGGVPGAYRLFANLVSPAPRRGPAL